MTGVLAHAVRRRRTGLIGWSVGLVGVVALIAVSYPAIRGNGELDRTFENLSPSIRSLLGLNGGTGLTSPAGYLDSQFFANLLPVMLLVFAIGVAAWTIAGDEAAGGLELLLANPVSRVRVALARFGALTLMVALLAGVTLAALLVARGPAGLDRLSPGGIASAVAACAALALCYGSVAFALGAAGVSRGTAIGAASALAVLGFALEGLGQAVTTLRPLRDAMPWHWLLDGDPLRNGPGWLSLGLPLLVAAVLVAAGTAVFARRDLR